MGTRPDLDLSDILPAYREFLGEYESTAGINFVKASVPEDQDYQEASLGWGSSQPHLQAGYVPRSMAARDEPYRVGNGPEVCSTSRVLVSTRPSFGWDVNGWYATIGVPFPYVDATSGALSRSYMAAGGQESPRATYFLKRLLNKAVRGLYDAYPLGEQFLDDEYVQDAIKARAADEAGRRSADGSYTKAQSVLDEWGYKLEEEDTPGVVDTTSNDVLDGVSPEDSPFEPIEWIYSHWLWRSTKVDATQQLERWQGLLVSALSQQGHHTHLAVGLCGDQPKPYAVRHVDGHWVVFLGENEEPTEELAALAAASLLDQTSTRQVTD